MQGTGVLALPSVKGNSSHLKGQGKMVPQIFFRFVWLAQPHTYSCFPRLNGNP